MIGTILTTNFTSLNVQKTTYMKLKSTDWTTLFLVSTGIFLFVLDLFIVNVSIPAIKQGLHLSDSNTQWVVILYAIGYASLLIISGKAGEYYGRKRLYIIGMIGFTVSSALCGLASNGALLLLGRIFQGISSALMVPQGISLIALLFSDKNKRIWAMGLYGSIAGIASIIGQLLGGILPDLDWLSEPWRLIFLINIPIGLSTALLAYLRLPESEKTPLQKLDIVGILLIVTTLLSAIYPLIMGPELSWPWWCFALLVLSAATFTLFAKKQQIREVNGAYTLISFSLLKNRAFQLGLGAAIAYYMVQDAYFIIHSLYLQKHLHFSSTDTGIAFFFQGIGYVVASLYVSKLVISKGKIVVLLGIGLMILGLLGHILLFKQTSISNPELFALLFIYGMGCGTVLPSLMTLALKDIAPQQIGIASGIYLTIQQLAICLGIVVIVGTFLHSQDKTSGLTETINTPYEYSNLLSVILLLFVGFFIAKLPKKEIQEI